MRCFSRRCSFADNRSRSRPLADVGYERHLRTDLRFDQHIITFYRAGSDRRIITGNGTFRHVTGVAEPPYSASAAATELGRPHSARDAAKQQIACRRNRTQHDGRHRDQRHTGYGSRTFIGFANPSKPMFHKAFHITRSFLIRVHRTLSDSVFTACFTCRACQFPKPKTHI